MHNIDNATVHGFGQEWSTFTQSERELSDAERQKIFDGYFDIFNWSLLPPNAVGADIGCGSGRWAKLVAPSVDTLWCIDPSDEALGTAHRNLMSNRNTRFSTGLDIIAPASLDFAYSLGVLHHVPNTYLAVVEIAKKLKKGAPFLIYLYYNHDNRPWWYRKLWQASNLLRVCLSRCPHWIKLIVSQTIAVCVYWPLARLSRGPMWPLDFYRDKSFYTMRTDAYDRFCTRLEKRFSKDAIREILIAAKFEDIIFSDKPPYWVAIGYKK